MSTLYHFPWPALLLNGISSKRRPDNLPYSFGWNLPRYNMDCRTYSVLKGREHSSIFRRCVFLGYPVIMNIAFFDPIWNRAKLMVCKFLTLTVWFNG